MSEKNLLDLKCEPCEGGIPPLTKKEEKKYGKQVDNWKIDREETHKISREFEFEDFVNAIKFVNEVAELAEEEGHHPNIHIYYNLVDLVLYTHAIGGLSENDYILAAKINEIYKNSE